MTFPTVPLMMMASSALITLNLAMTGTAQANPLPSSDVPLPQTRPPVNTDVESPGPRHAFAAPSSETTASIPRTPAPVAIPANLKKGLDALSDDDVQTARAMRDSLPAGSLDQQILAWAIARSGLPGVPSRDIAAAARELTGWPGLTALRAQSERAVAREAPPPADVINLFAGSEPETAEGAMLLARALMTKGEKDEARRIVTRFWASETMDVNMENLFLRAFSGLLERDDHKRRMDMLLYRSRINQAERFSEMAKAQSLFKARAAVERNDPKAEIHLKAVHRMWHEDPGYLYARIMFLRRADKDDEAARLLAKMPRDRQALVDPDKWWNEQRIVARGLLELGEAKEAYSITANHVAASPLEIADAEFHAGWIALRKLGNAKDAARHFEKILTVARGPISIARAHYWLGRAAEKGGPGDARAHFARAAAYPTTFYGQLASARLDENRLNVRYPAPSEEDRLRFAGRQAVQAITRLEAAGHPGRAHSLYRALARELTSPGELAILAAMAEKRDNHTLGLAVGRLAYNRGIDVAALAYPIGVIPSEANIAGSGKALAYAIARQESAFNPGAVSPANAMGLLQLLPKTAKAVAGRHGMAYSKAKLTRDPGYNATLGAHYLGEQIDAFDGSYILTFIAYNAGPRRVPQWIERFGDPRGRPIDEVVDWIELIPFPETRSYVQRVIENYQVYKTRLGQQTDIVADLRFGRR